MKKYLLIFLILLMSNILWSNPLDYYHLHFKKKEKHPLHDTLFKKTIHRRKVSHILIEEKSIHKYWVTLLMISPYPHNYKSQNYPVHYEFKNWQKAYDKLLWLDKFLDKNGIARITLKGSTITKEEILFYNKSISKK